MTIFWILLGALNAGLCVHFAMAAVDEKSACLGFVAVVHLFIYAWCITGAVIPDAREDRLGNGETSARQYRWANACEADHASEGGAR